MLDTFGGYITDGELTDSGITDVALLQWLKEHNRVQTHADLSLGGFLATDAGYIDLVSLPMDNKSNLYTCANAHPVLFLDKNVATLPERLRVRGRIPLAVLGTVGTFRGVPI